MAADAEAAGATIRRLIAQLGSTATRAGEVDDEDDDRSDVR